MKRPIDERSRKDRVCGVLVSRLTVFAEAEFQSKTYYFCVPQCRDAFLADPPQNLHLHRHHGLKARPPMP
jgi:YHS domain-containing protein